MRYTPVLVLGTLAVAEAAGHNARHASFHARRQAEKRTPGDYGNVNWKALSYDLTNVDWDSVFGKKAAATPPPQAQAHGQAPPAESKPAAPAPTPTPQPMPPPQPSQPEQGSQNHDGGGASNDFAKDLSSFFGKIGVKTDNCNSESSNGKIWLGKSSQWRAKFVNGGSEGVYMTCWTKVAADGDEFAGFALAKNPPLIAGYLTPGAEQYVSFADNVPSVCAPLKNSNPLAMFGGVDNTWFEATFTNQGKFDISRNVNMHGTDVVAKGSKCTSSMDECVFKCTGGQSSCEKGYDLFNCGSSNGGGGGYDAKMQGTGGGCDMGASGEEVTVTFS